MEKNEFENMPMQDLFNWITISLIDRNVSTNQYVSANHTFLKRLRELEQERKWISVDEKDALPEESLFVLVYVPKCLMSFMAYRKKYGTGKNQWEWISKFEEIKYGITHWQPMPQNPQP